MRLNSFRNLFKNYFVGVRSAEHRLGSLRKSVASSASSFNSTENLCQKPVEDRSAGGSPASIYSGDTRASRPRSECIDCFHD